MTDNGAPPADDVVYPAQVNEEFLYTFFHSAYFSVHRDEAGDVYLKDSFTTWVFPQEGGEQIRLMAQFRANPEVSRELKLEYANIVNDGLKLVRAYVDSDDDIGFDYYITLDGGITKRTLALTARRFAEYVRAALQRDEQDILG